MENLTLSKIIKDMNAAEQLRDQLINGGLFDKQEVLNTVINGIKNGGYSEIIVPYNPPQRVVCGTHHIECSDEQCEAIKEFLKSQGFRVRRAYHPVSGRPYGYEASL